ncbi:MAG: DUF134 domain-containing protein [Clostridia bacterium]|nr:DUF134 domain-containing protein [Clostridia bacterium]
MARPQRCRRICKEPTFDSFFPGGRECAGAVTLSVDEFEVIRLVDYEKNTHEQCAARMDISRTTVTEIYESARFKLSDSIVNGKKLVIGGGNYRLCDGVEQKSCGMQCHVTEYVSDKIIKQKGENIMRVAVTYENGQVFQHFGHTKQFMLFDIENNEVVSSQIIDVSGGGHGALAGFLSSNNVDTLICGGIGGGAKDALTNAGIKYYGGVRGSVERAASDFAKGSLLYDPFASCSDSKGHGHHHGEGHECGEHGCHE